MKITHNPTNLTNKNHRCVCSHCHCVFEAETNESYATISELDSGWYAAPDTCDNKAFDKQVRNAIIKSGYDLKDCSIHYENFLHNTIKFKCPSCNNSVDEYHSCTPSSAAMVKVYVTEDEDVEYLKANYKDDILDDANTYVEIKSIDIPYQNNIVIPLMIFVPPM